MLKVLLFLIQNNKNKSNFFGLLLIFISLFKCYYLDNKCNKDEPLLKEKNCVSSCETSEINNGTCTINNDIIKTQWLGHIINIKKEGNYVYVNIVTSENNNLFLLSSTYPESNNRLVYLLNSQGYGFPNIDNPISLIEIVDTGRRGKFESELFSFKLYERI